MNDTSATMSEIVLERYRSMTPAERWLVAASLFETARKIVDASLPSGLNAQERRLAFIRRFYEHELPEEALIAYSRYAP